jgi:hypothetical protein
VPAAPDHAPTLAAPGRRRPPQRATPKNSRRGFFGSPSGRTLSRRHLPHGTAPGYRACGYKTASGRPQWLSRDPLGETSSNISLSLTRSKLPTAVTVRPRDAEIIEGPNLYDYVHDEPTDAVDPTGLVAIYGNWCGPDWTGGQVEEYSPKHTRDHYQAPIDLLDAACKGHDICYYRCRHNNPCSPAGRSQCFRQCDHLLTDAAYAVGGFWGDTIGAAIDRPGTRDPGPNAGGCGCGGK